MQENKDRPSEFSAWDDFKFTLLPIIALALIFGGIGFLVLSFF